MKIPWKLKSLAFSIIDTLGAPWLLYILQKHVTKRSRITKLRLDYIWREHRATLEKYNATNLIFEFGGGKNLAQNLYLSSLVDRQVVVDLNPMVDIKLVEIARNLLACSVELKSKKVIQTLNDLQHYGITYISPMDAAETDFENTSLDACISTNTLEHIPKEGIVLIFKELYRTLKKDGIVSARIDYSDHYAHTDPSISLLNYLKYSETEWLKYNHRSHYQNRLRHDDYVTLFADCGFKVIEEKLSFECTSIPQSLIEKFGDKDGNWAATSSYLVLKKAVVG